MINFLHVGDIHLGYRQYKLLERERDFFRAFLDICQKHAIDKAIDFVLVTGDLFNNRSISPQTFNEAIFVFNKLKAANIPVIAIEGNHDFKELGNFNNLKGSWYESLAQNELIYFLYPSFADNKIVLNPLKLNEKFLGGAYIDLPIKSSIIRIVGSRWQGFNAGASLPKYVEAIESLPSKATKTIFMFHAGHENYLAVNRGGVSGADFMVLSKVVDYVALGHIHEHHIIQNNDGQNFLFNPGSTEANSIAETNIQRGGILGTINGEADIETKLIKDYYQRPFVKLESINVLQFPNQDELLQEAYKQAKEQLNKFTNQQDLPIIQINFHGYPEFERSNQALNELKQKIEDEGALYCIINWDVEKKEISYIEPSSEPLKRSEFERILLNQILENDLSLNAPEELTEMMLRVKSLLANNQADPKELLHEIESFEEMTSPSEEVLCK